VPHADQHSNANDAIEAIESTLGVNPQGGSATVVARLTALDSTVAGKAPATGISPSAITGTAVTQADTGTVTSAMIANGTIVDADVSASAAIATSKISGLDTALSAKASLASPALTGTPTTTTAAVDTNTTQIASTAFVLGQAGSATPVVDGTAAVGTSTRFARQDHVHPTDTTRAAVAGQTFTGAIAAPNITDSALTVAGIVTNTSAGLLGTVATVPTTNLPSASTSAAGIAQLSDSTSTTSSTVAATSTAVKSAWDLANGALSIAGGTMSGSIDMSSTGITNAGSITGVTSLVLPYVGAGSTKITLYAGGGYNTSLTLPANSSGTAVVATSANANSFTVGGQSITNDTGQTSIVPLTLTGAASQNANLLNINNSAGNPSLTVSPSGTLTTSGNLNAGSLTATGAKISGISGAAGNVTALFRGYANQTANLLQFESSTPAVQGGRTANAQIFSGSTVPIAGAASTITQTVVTAGSNVVYTTSAAHNYSPGDLVTITGITTAQGLPATSPVYITAVGTTTTFTAAVTTGTSGTYTSLTGSSTIPAQTSITARSFGTKGLIVKGATSQAANLLEVQNSSATNLLSVDPSGNIGIADSATVPTADPTSGGILYSASGLPRWRGLSTGGNGAIPMSFLAILTSTKTHTATAAGEAVFAGAPGTTNGAITLKAGTWYEIEGTLVVDRASVSGTASGVAIAGVFANTPQTYSLTAQSFTPNSSSGASAVGAGTASVSGNIIIVSNTATSNAATGFTVLYKGFVKTNATTGGTFTLQFVQATTGGTLTTGQCAVEAGSFMKITELPASAIGNWS
jgi:hypothetical protein